MKNAFYVFFLKQKKTELWIKTIQDVTQSQFLSWYKQI